VWCSTKTTFNVYVSQGSQLQFEDEDHAVNMSFRWVTTSLSSLRTTTCDALIVPSEASEVTLFSQESLLKETKYHFYFNKYQLAFYNDNHDRENEMNNTNTRKHQMSIEPFNTTNYISTKCYDQQ